MPKRCEHFTDKQKADNLYNIEGFLTFEEGLEWFLEEVGDRAEYDRILASPEYKAREGTDCVTRIG
jgi:hypothetical protein